MDNVPDTTATVTAPYKARSKQMKLQAIDNNAGIALIHHSDCQSVSTLSMMIVINTLLANAARKVS